MTRTAGHIDRSKIHAVTWAIAAVAAISFALLVYPYVASNVLLYKGVLAVERSQRARTESSRVSALNEAADTLEQSVRLRRSNWRARYLLAGVLVDLADYQARNGRPGDAVLLAKRAIKRFPNMVDAYVSLGLLYENLGRLDLAENAYRRGLSVSLRLQRGVPESETPLVMMPPARLKEILARLLAKQGRTGEAAGRRSPARH